MIKLETEFTSLTKTVEAGFTQTNEAITKLDTKLDGALPTYLTKEEFRQYKSSQNVQKVLLSVLMLIIGGLVGFFISNIGKGA